MKLYNKKLRSLADLKHEKQLLLREHKVTRKHMEDPWSLIKQRKKKNKSEDEDGGINWASMIGKLIGSNSVPVDIALTLAGPLLGKAGRKSGNVIKKLAVEVLGGYLKWKLIDIGFNLAKKVLKKHK